MPSCMRLRASSAAASSGNRACQPRALAGAVLNCFILPQLGYVVRDCFVEKRERLYAVTTGQKLQYAVASDKAGGTDNQYLFRHDRCSLSKSDSHQVEAVIGAALDGKQVYPGPGCSGKPASRRPRS